MTVALAFAIGAAVLWSTCTLLWLWSVKLGDASIIDIFWGLLFVFVAWTLYAVANPDGAEPLLMLGLVTLWGLRLAFHLFQRNAGRGEDVRYQRWRAAGGSGWWLASYWRVYLLQGGIALVVASPIVATMSTPSPLGLLDLIGVVLFVVGFHFELTGDWLLDRHRKSGSTAVLDAGVWRYSRHPNYFGDLAQWAGLGLIAVSAQSWWALAGPVAMALVFLRISSPLLERGLARTRPDYADYVRRTPAFFPWFPRRP